MAIHVAITRKVIPGKEDEFKKALRDFLGESFMHSGVYGASMITSFPGADSNEIGILRTFKDEAERDAFYRSDLFKEWEAYASALTEAPVYRHLTGLEAWFRSSAPPPRWKMAVATLCGVFPTSFFLSLAVGPFIKSFPLPMRLFVIAALMVCLLTWVVMPFVTRILKRWLRNDP